MNREEAVHSVTHDFNGDWQVLGPNGSPEDLSMGRIVSLRNAVELEPAILELADLARGERAWRAGAGQPWTRSCLNYREAVLEHYKGVWSDPKAILRFGKGPVERLPKGFRILHFGHPSGAQVYATWGMSQPGDEVRLELFMLTNNAPEEDVLQFLTIVADFHRCDVQLGLWHTINFGQPWTAGSSCDYGYLSLPYLDGPDLEWMGDTRFLWLIPVSKSEVDFKKREGQEALERLFEQQQFNHCDSKRRPVV